MTENGLFVLGGPETQLHDILWAVHDRKNRGRSKGTENIGESPVTVGEQITVEQLIEKRILMRISRHDHVYTLQKKDTSVTFWAERIFFLSYI